jgi:hypothetical protein
MHLQDKAAVTAAGNPCRDAAAIPGRLALLEHAAQLLAQHPNMQLRYHPASALTQVAHKQRHKQRKAQERQVRAAVVPSGQACACTDGMRGETAVCSNRQCRGSNCAGAEACNARNSTGKRQRCSGWDHRA